MNADHDRDPSRSLQAASEALDERPAARVRAAVLAEATSVAIARRAHGPRRSAVRQWPRSLAALLVVSVMAGLPVTHVARDEPGHLSPGAERIAAAPAGRVDDVSSAKPSATKSPALTLQEASAPPPARILRSRDGTPLAPIPPRAIAPARPAPPAAPDQRESAAPAAASPPPPQLAPIVVYPVPSDEAAPSTHAKAAVMDAAPAPMAVRARGEAPPSADALVARIALLRQDGKDAEADRLVVELRTRYPDFTVPPEALRSIDPR